MQHRMAGNLWSFGFRMTDNMRPLDVPIIEFVWLIDFRMVEHVWPFGFRLTENTQSFDFRMTEIM